MERAKFLCLSASLRPARPADVGAPAAKSQTLHTHIHIYGGREEAKRMARMYMPLLHSARQGDAANIRQSSKSSTLSSSYL